MQIFKQMFKLFSQGEWVIEKEVYNNLIDNFPYMVMS